MEKVRRRSPIEVAETPLRLKVTYPDDTVHFDEVRAPSAEFYAAFVRELVSITNKLRDGGDPLEGSVQALRAVMDYMQGDQTTFVSGACQPLVNILGATHDTLHGSKKNMLQGREGKVGRPTDLEVHRASACLILALNTLIDSGIDEVSAAKVVIDELKRVHVAYLEPGKIFQSGDLLKLRRRILNCEGPKILQQLYTELERESIARGMLAAADTREGARRFARVMVMSMAVNRAT